MSVQVLIIYYSGETTYQGYMFVRGMQLKLRLVAEVTTYTYESTSTQHGPLLSESKFVPQRESYDNRTTTRRTK